MFPGARKLSSHARKPSFFFTACMGGYLCGIIVAAGTHVVVAIAAGAHPRFTGACGHPWWHYRRYGCPTRASLVQ